MSKMNGIESIITSAMMGALDGTLNPPGVSLARIAVSNAVQRAISCQSPTKCGRVLDQSSAALFSFGEDAEHGQFVVNPNGRSSLGGCRRTKTWLSPSKRGEALAK